MKKKKGEEKREAERDHEKREREGEREISLSRSSFRVSSDTAILLSSSNAGGIIVPGRRAVRDARDERKKRAR